MPYISSIELPNDEHNYKLLAEQLDTVYEISGNAGYYKFFEFQLTATASRTFIFVITDTYPGNSSPYSGIVRFYVNFNGYTLWTIDAQWLTLSKSGRSYYFSYTKADDGTISLYIYKNSQSTGNLGIKLLVSVARKDMNYNPINSWIENPTALESLPSNAIVADMFPIYQSNRNYIRNWYFVGGGEPNKTFPINTRGYSTYSTSRMTIDGWHNGNNGYLNIDSNYIQLRKNNSSAITEGTLAQKIDNPELLYGRQVCLSVLTDNNQLYSQSVLLSSTIPSSNTEVINIADTARNYTFVLSFETDGALRVIFYNSNDSDYLNLIACKLELGSNQTLCYRDTSGTYTINEFPIYEEELNRCLTSTSFSIYTDTFANKNFATTQQIAPIETGLVAIDNHAVNTFICWRNKFYRVISAIATGDTIAVNTNVVEDSLIDEIQSGSVFFGRCGTAAGTQAKTVTIPGVSSLYDGLKICVQFSNSQDYDGTPTLNVNNLGAYDIWRSNASYPAGKAEWYANTVLNLVFRNYNNTQGWLMVNHGHASTTYYGMTKLSNSVSDTSTTLAATANSVKTVYDQAVATGDYYATCSTAAATVTKVATVSNANFPSTLFDGLRIHVLFTNYNSASSPTLNVNNTGAKSIYYAAQPYENLIAGSWDNYQLVDFTYNSSSDVWVMNAAESTAKYLQPDHLISGNAGWYKVFEFSVSQSTSRTFDFIIHDDYSYYLYTQGILRIFFDRPSSGNAQAVVQWLTYVSKPDYVRYTLSNNIFTLYIYKPGKDGTLSFTVLQNLSRVGITRSIRSCWKSESVSEPTSATNSTLRVQPLIQPATVSLPLSWSSSTPYTETVTVSGYTVTSLSKISLHPTAAQLTQLIADGVSAITIENNNGTLTAYSIGAKPTTAMTIACTVTEVGQ